MLLALLLALLAPATEAGRAEQDESAAVSVGPSKPIIGPKVEAKQPPQPAVSWADLIRATQLRRAKKVQKAIQSALWEMSKGLRRIALAEPSLLPNVNKLDESVSGELARASGAIGQSESEQARGKITSGLVKLSQGLQRISSSNPNLVANASKLYRKVSGKLSKASRALSSLAD